MDAQRWAQIRSLFHASLEHQPEGRRTFLEGQCQEDPELLEEVTALLKAHEAEGTLLETPLIQVPPLEGEPPPGEAIGIYRLQERLGQGGMGTVYRAARADGEYHSEVAVKVMHSNLEGKVLVRRFLQERQILANLRHPNIARLLDGGTTDEGRPFLVMEYVEGEPIDRYCERHRLTILQRLRLFRKVCTAVHFAHQNLVVHRDLKPANILVSPEGEPKLLDFGIAKLLGPASSFDLTAAGKGGGAPMTPENAAPEQMSKGPITTATDVYALGVLLYQLLTGRYPFRLEDLGVEAFVHAVCHRDPTPPSHCPGAEHSLLRGDLDAILARALRKESERRYPSAEHFSRDLERHLQDRPVVARENTLPYRAGRFLRRHRLGVATAGFALLVSAIFTGTLVVQQQQILAEQAQSREVTRFLEGLFEISEPDRALGERVTARELLDRGALDIRRRLDQQPALKANLLGTMGRAYRKLGLYPEAEPLLTEAHDLQLRGHGNRHPAVAASLIDLGEQRVATGRYGEGEALFQQALDGRPTPEAAIRARAAKAESLRLQGRYEEAEQLHRRALGAAQEELGPDHPQLAHIADRLGNLLREKGEYDAAHEAYRSALQIRLRLHGERHPSVAELHNHLGLLAHERGKFPAAREHFETALALQQEIYEPGHRHTAAPLHNLAAVLDSMNAVEEAEEMCREALRIRRQALGEAHPNIADSLNLLGLIRHHRGDREGAANLLRQALEMWTELLGPDFVKVAAARNNLGQVLQEMGQMEGARAEFKEALRLYSATYGPHHTQVAVVLNNLGLLSKMQGEIEAALDYYRRGLETTRRLLGPDHPHVATLSHNLAVLLQQQGDLAAAETLYRSSFAAFSASLEPTDPRLGLARKNLASVLLGQENDPGRSERLEEAARLLEEALDLFAAGGIAPTDLGVVVSRSLLGQCRALQGRSDEARTLLADAHSVALQHYGASHPLTLKTGERQAKYGSPDTSLPR